MHHPCLCLLLVSFSAGAAEMRSIEVDFVDDRYVMHSEVWFAVGIESLYAVFLDWDVSTQFSSAIIESREIEPDASGRRRFYTRNRGCVLFFCMSFERSGYIEHEPFKFIRATANPEISDFHLSEETWKFRTEGLGTIVIYDLEFEPKFWVPPVIGPYLIKRKLRRDGGGAIDRIEAIAQEWQQ